MRIGILEFMVVMSDQRGILPMCKNMDSSVRSFITRKFRPVCFGYPMSDGMNQHDVNSAMAWSLMMDEEVEE